MHDPPAVRDHDAASHPVSAYRRAGSRWRLLVHDMAPKGATSTARNIQSHPTDRSKYPADLRAKSEAFEADMLTKGYAAPAVILPDTEFDELVVGQWLHIEQMGSGEYWMNIGGVTIDVTADRDGRPTSVLVQGPADYDSPRENCVYECLWTAP